MEADPQSRFTGDLQKRFAVTKSAFVSTLQVQARKILNLADTETIFLMTGNVIPSVTATIGEIYEVSLELFTN